MNAVYERYINEEFSKPIKDNTLNVVGYGIYNNLNENKATKRYFLKVNLNSHENNSKTLVALLMNPSKTYPDTGFDRTIKTVIKIAKKEQYKKLIILNSFPDIESDGNKAQTSYRKDTINTEFIKIFLNNYTERFDIFSACGDIISDELFNSYLKQINECTNKNQEYLWTFANLTKKGRTRHVSPKARYNIKLLKDFMENKTKKQLLKIESETLQIL